MVKMEVKLMALESNFFFWCLPQDLTMQYVEPAHRILSAARVFHALVSLWEQLVVSTNVTYYLRRGEDLISEAEEFEVHRHWIQPQHRNSYVQDVPAPHFENFRREEDCLFNDAKRLSTMDTSHEEAYKPPFMSPEVFLVPCLYQIMFAPPHRVVFAIT